MAGMGSSAADVAALGLRALLTVGFGGRGLFLDSRWVGLEVCHIQAEQLTDAFAKNRWPLGVVIF